MVHYLKISLGWSTEARSSLQCLSGKHLLVNASPGHDWHASSSMCMTESRALIVGPVHLMSVLLLCNNRAYDGRVPYWWVRCRLAPLLIWYWYPTFSHSHNVMCQVLCWARGTPAAGAEGVKILMRFLSLGNLAMGNGETAHPKASARKPGSGVSPDVSSSQNSLRQVTSRLKRKGEVESSRWSAWRWRWGEKRENS